MPLVKCRECGKEVSTEAGTCPQCGAPRPTTSSSSGPLPESPFKTGPQKPLVPKPAPPVEARLKELREKRGREAQRRTVARIMWGGVALALVGIGYWALREAGSANGSPWPFAPTELACAVLGLIDVGGQRGADARAGDNATVLVGVWATPEVAERERAARNVHRQSPA